MAKHIGIVAVSYEGAALCYQTICSEAASLMGEHFHPEITMHTFPLGQYLPFVSKLDWEGTAQLLLKSVVKGILKDSTREYFQSLVAELAEQGCDAVVMACTEIPLILRPDDVEIPLLDSTRLLATAAVKKAFGPDV